MFQGANIANCHAHFGTQLALGLKGEIKMGNITFVDLLLFF